MVDSIAHSKPTLSDREADALSSILNSGMVASGKKVREFISTFSSYVQKEHISLYSSGTSAFYHLLMAYGVKESDEVLMPTYICDSVEKAIIMCGGKPVFYDNSKKSWLSAYENIKKHVTKQTKLILINHTFGIIFDRDEIKRIKQLNVPVIDDCAHAILGDHSSKYTDASFYSFHATKMLTTGEGGAIGTNNFDLKNELDRQKLDNGISDISASIGLVQLNQYNEFLKIRKDIANKYFEGLGSITKEIKALHTLYFRFPILVNNDKNFLQSKVVNYKKGVDSLIHQKYLLPDSLYQNAVDIFTQTISLPIYPSLTNFEISMVIEETQRLYSDT